MSQSFYFYDLETTGVNPREDRIMQFAGQRTDMDLSPVGEPHNILIKLSEDIVPDPGAILITGISPQKTIDEGLTEAEFLKIFYNKISTPDTIFVGYNSVRFDDEFMRYLNFRNFYDPYEWQYTNNKSRWDLLDVVRMTRSLRPSGIEWPVGDDGRATNRLEELTKINGLEHSSAHDALSDVNATIAVASLIKRHQPKLFDYLLGMRDKRLVEKLVDTQSPFVYCSGKYDTQFEKTAVVVKISEQPERQGALVYDLRYDPTPFLKLSVESILAGLKLKHGEEGVRVPVKTIQYNKCPAVAPLAVLDEASQQRLEIDLDSINNNLKILQNSNLNQLVNQAYGLFNSEQKKSYSTQKLEPDARLYDGFIGNMDKGLSRSVPGLSPDNLSSTDINFTDKRLNQIILLYKSRNFSTHLTDEERQDWEKYRTMKLLGGGNNSRMMRYFSVLSELSSREDISANDRYLLEELQLYGQSIMPVDDSL